MVKMNLREVVFKDSLASLYSVVKHFPVKYLYSGCDEYSVTLTYMGVSQIFDNKTRLTAKVV